MKKGAIMVVEIVILLVVNHKLSREDLKKLNGKKTLPCIVPVTMVGMCYIV
jgi:hypothetical protein